MAFPTVPTVAANTLLSSTTTTASTTHTFPNLTTLAPAAGDLIIAICVQYSGTSGGSPNDQFSSWGAGLTETRDDETTTANDLAIGVAHKIATGTESDVFSVTSVFAARSVNFLMRIPAATWHGTTIPEVLAAVRANLSVADPGSFDPTNWASEDTLWISVYGHSETTTTGSPPTIDTPPSNFTGQLIVPRNADAVGHITAAVAFRQQNATAQDVGTWTVTNPTRGNSLASVIAVRPASAPIVRNLTAATSTELSGGLVYWAITAKTETDTAQALVKAKRVALVPKAETDVAQQLTFSQAATYNLTPAVETDQAQTLIVRKWLVAATETDAAQATNVDKGVARTAASESDAAETLNTDKRVTAVFAAETDAAQAVTFSQTGPITLTPATSTETAGGLVRWVVSAVTETDAAQTLTVSAGGRTLTPATETDQAQALSIAAPIQVTLVPVEEWEQAGQLAALRVTAAVETDQAQPLSVAAGGRNLTAATETDQAQAVSFTKTIRKTLVAVTETDQAQILEFGGPQILQWVTETDVALTLSVTKTIFKTIAFAAETDTAVVLDKDKHVTVVARAETDVAQALGKRKFATRVPATETDLATQLVRTVYHAIVAVIETDTAEQLAGSWGNAIFPAAETDVALALSVTSMDNEPILTGWVALPSSGGSGGGTNGRIRGAKTGRIQKERIFG